MRKEATGNFGFSRVDFTRNSAPPNRSGRCRMTGTNDLDAAIERVCQASTGNFVDLVSIAGLDPAKDFRYANLCDVNFAGCDLAGFDFRGALLHRAIFENARIAGAKFSRSAGLDQLLKHAVDAN